MGMPTTDVGGPATVKPPQPDIYIFSQVSTKNATGEIFTFATGPEPYTVEKIAVLKALSSFITNWLEPALLYTPGGKTGNAPRLCPMIYTLLLLSSCTP